MVLASLSVFKTEQELRDLCDCVYKWIKGSGKYPGTDPFLLAEEARKAGFAKTRKYNLTFDELRSELDRGLYPIVFIRTNLIADRPPQ